MSKYKIVIADYYYSNLDAEYDEFTKLGSDLEVVDCTKIVPGGIKDPRQLINYARDCDGLIVQFAKIDAEFIRELQKCKVIARYAIGVDIIDVPSAKAKGIWVANVPDYCIPEVADTAAMHILNAARKLTITRDMLLVNDFDMNLVGPIFRTEDAVLALLGFGNIARNLYSKMKPFFKHVVAYDPYFSNTADYPDVAFMPLADALGAADIISIHVPLNPSTKDMLGTEQFNIMKNGVILVNTSRGGIIDEAALLDALNCGKIGFAGLDVLCTEDYINTPFLRHPRVALTPHLAWRSIEAQAELQRKTARNVVEALVNGKPLYTV
jgi:D-3-phosphoglycerate dehydrogenase / 2-oxoglutarate reductase